MEGEIALNNFFVFNSVYGSSEGEEYKKILYYYPKTEDIDTQIKNIGLVEAIIQFTGTFKPSSPVNSMHTQKKRQLYCQPEEGFWMVMTLSVSLVEKNKESENSSEQVANDIQDNVYEAVLKQMYSLYKLFNGPFSFTLKGSDISTLKSKLQQFYDNYLLKSLKLSNCDILNVFNGIQYLPLNKQNFLNVQCFIDELECNYQIIEFTLFLFNDCVIWSGLKPEDLQTLYQYLITIHLPLYMETELQGGSMPRNQSSPFASLYHGRFINMNLKTATSVGKLPKVYLLNNNKLASYYLLVYRTLSASICLFINDANTLSVPMFRELDGFMGPKLLTIVSEIAEYCSQQISTPSHISESAPRFIYFNKMNLAYKSTIHLDNKQTGNLACPKDSVKIIANMNGRKYFLGYSGEIIVKTINDSWVAGKVSNSREFYVTLQQKNANLIEISDEVKKLCETELKGIFFHSIEEIVKK